MELYVELLRALLEKEELRVTFPQLKLEARELLESLSYQVLGKIVETVRDGTLSDAECFAKIERIVCILEENGIDTGNRHDFG